MASWKDVQDTRVARGVVLSQKPDGNWVFYHQDGPIAITAEYNKGLRNCTWKYYLSKRHSLMTFEDLNAEQRAGITNKYRILARIEEYEQGELVWHEEYYHFMMW